jgi:hypothetical protein
MNAGAFILRAVAELPQIIPAALRPDLAAKPPGHPRRHLGAGPQATVGWRLGQGVPQRHFVLLAEERPGAGVLRPLIAKPAGTLGVVAAHDLGDPPLAIAGDGRHLALAPTLAQQPDDLQVGTLDRQPGRSITLAQLRRAQMSNQGRG